MLYGQDIHASIWEIQGLDIKKESKGVIEEKCHRINAFKQDWKALDALLLHANRWNDNLDPVNCTSHTPTQRRESDIFSYLAVRRGRSMYQLEVQLYPRLLAWLLHDSRLPRPICSQKKKKNKARKKKSETERNVAMMEIIDSLSLLPSLSVSPFLLC